LAGGISRPSKAALVDLAVTKLGPIGAEMQRLKADPAFIDSVLIDGAARARRAGRENMAMVEGHLGFVR